MEAFGNFQKMKKSRNDTWRYSKSLALPSKISFWLVPLVIHNLIAGMFALYSYQGKVVAGEQKGEKVMELKSTAFTQGGDIPKKYTCDGADVSPPLNWTEPPEGTKSLALICEDPDAPVGTWVHWVLFNLPPNARELPESVPARKTLSGGGDQGINDFRKIGYGGPCPPKGPVHRYFFKLYALDKQLDLKPGATRQELAKAMKNHILAEAELMGRYHR